MNSKLLKVLFLFTLMHLSRAIENANNADTSNDLQTSATSAKLLNLGGLLGGGNAYYPSNTRPNYYPSNNGFYPSTGYYPSNGGFYPSTGYYPTTGGNYPTNGYYPTNSYPNSGYPSSGWNNAGSYYPTNTYYPSGTGTNILPGNGGYGGYGGNGGLRQYSGYWNPNYHGRRNLGYGYYKNTDRYGLPKLKSKAQYTSRQDADCMPHSYRGYD
ncbi:prisilkin-39 isoform X1 [Musca domestica]|uniref:Prisilkin-39 isoform X1 n=1 Tax=Musca domestica TaxID=7370 RepID=A0ABM3VKQ9_MUSDO|nr:prisilkin-39 isoform X1 [Musca domestica]